MVAGPLLTGNGQEQEEELLGGVLKLSTRLLDCDGVGIGLSVGKRLSSRYESASAAQNSIHVMEVLQNSEACHCHKGSNRFCVLFAVHYYMYSERPEYSNSTLPPPTFGGEVRNVYGVKSMCVHM